ncbi:transposase [Magnetovibrio sp. PR-2]|uniref:transposase n=1 Tax=Magnetovibrio sp. PR-2 TaxID=3120356 RepID=UPI003FA53858
MGRSRGGRTSKVHAAVDESGRPRCLIITGGQVHDRKVMTDLLDDAGEASRSSPTKLTTHIPSDNVLPIKARSQ